MTLTPGAMRPPAFSTRLRKTGDAASLRRRRLVVRASLFGKTGVCWNAFRGAGAAFGIRPGPPVPGAQALRRPPREPFLEKRLRAPKPFSRKTPFSAESRPHCGAPGTGSAFGHSHLGTL